MEARIINVESYSAADERDCAALDEWLAKVGVAKDQLVEIAEKPSIGKPVVAFTHIVRDETGMPVLTPDKSGFERATVEMEVDTLPPFELFTR